MYIVQCFDRSRMIMTQLSAGFCTDSLVKLVSVSVIFSMSCLSSTHLPSPLCGLWSHHGGEETALNPLKAADKWLSSCIYKLCQQASAVGAEWKVPWGHVAEGQSTSFIFLNCVVLCRRVIWSGLSWCNTARASQELHIGQGNKEGWTQSHIKDNTVFCSCLHMSNGFI